MGGSGRVIRSGIHRLAGDGRAGLVVTIGWRHDIAETNHAAHCCTRYAAYARQNSKLSPLYGVTVLLFTPLFRLSQLKALFLYLSSKPRRPVHWLIDWFLHWPPLAVVC
jgi:hypothetical protein